MSLENIWNLDNVEAGWNPIEGFLKGVSLNIQKGERIAIIGYTSSGRELLIRAMAGLRPIRSGVLKILGNQVPQLKYFQQWDHLLSMKERRKLGISMEQDGLLGNVSVREGLEMLLRFQGDDQSDEGIVRAREVVQRVLLHFHVDRVADRRPYELSAVEKRLSSLARAFLSDPSVVILENPTQDLGDFVRHRFWAVLESLAQDKLKTFVISTDDFSLAAHFCPRWIVMDEGKVFYDGDPAGFLKTSHSLVQHFKSYVKLRHTHEAELLEGLVA